MGGGATDASTAPPYSLPPRLFMPEDILFCVDIGPESGRTMRVSGPKGNNVLTSLDAIKQALLLFAHAKLTMCMDDRFAFSYLGSSFSMVKEFTNNIKSVAEVVRTLTAPDVLSEDVDITKLFEVANCEGNKSRALGRLFRVVLIYCRSSVWPQYKWPAKQKTFTMDVVYLHDKPGPDNCPQLVYDALGDAAEQVSEHVSYIFETGQGLTRILFRHMCILLVHPIQRCAQDDIDMPKPVVKRVLPGGGDGTMGEERAVISNLFKH
ncbi:BRISC and BRCA1-A complex member 1 [Rhynchospora pubera]|uniref:BRISC and BRCA1-A complex member 1 n=1 Tax=Rhynchospora pubera TaxID=906938 RepID=A0AAV8H1P0_9POAL|nr:BRISC and BRCA1-A complex member 1 [Rhynchospora pubera]